ncbi:DUF6355 family natural product biosynthesis protein [Streptomyces sp. NPDC004111]|uniref:DUF6355 family natural product biosynthesis protein n=1 Tax=Streptomyces sp. NPDC004111 TaxID=3364690 RepID=UPI0036A41537
MRKTIRGVLAGAAVATVAVGMTGMSPASASTAPAGVTAAAQQQDGKPGVKGDPCGWFANPGAYYNHCGTGNVVIYVDRWNIGGISDYEKCVGPGTTYLGGGWPDFQGAWYVGRSC